jgi:hypothetical protein
VSIGQVGDEIGSLLGLLEPREDHLCACNVLLGVEEVVVQGALLYILLNCGCTQSTV